jgi:GTP cyclohydrolase I
MIDEIAAQNAIRKLLSAFDIKNERHPDIEKTPERVVKMLMEVWQGEQYTNDDIADMFGKIFICEDKNMVIVSEIPCFSHCEHHLALIYNLKVSVGYLPNGKVIGLSKIARIVDMVCRRLQLQERICADILEIMAKIIGNDVIVYVEGEHSCMTARGIKKTGTVTKTIAYDGKFKEEIYRKEFFSMLRGV